MKMENPEVEVVKFRPEDIITESGKESCSSVDGYGCTTDKCELEGV